MNLLEYKIKNKNIFKNVKNYNQYIVYYANTEYCTAQSYINIEKASDGVGYVSKDNKKLEQKIIRACNQKDALIYHLFMNSNIYQDLQGIEYN